MRRTSGASGTLKWGVLEMAKFHFTVKDDFSAKLQQSVSPASARAAHILAIQMAKDTEKYVPALTKSMVNKSHPGSKRMMDESEVDGDTIIYPGPYARFLYKGKLMVDPETGSAWARPGTTKVLKDKNLVFSKSVHASAQDHWFEASKAQNLSKWKRVAERAFASELKKG